MFAVLRITARIGCEFIRKCRTLSPFAPQKCVNEAHFRGAKGDNNKITARSAVLHCIQGSGCGFRKNEPQALLSRMEENNQKRNCKSAEEAIPIAHFE